MAFEPTVIPVVVGGAIALAGTVVSQFFGLLSGWIDRRHRRDTRKREALEEMSELISKTLPWFQSLSSCHTIEDVRATPPPIEARRIAIVASLNFPKLVQPAKAYTNGLIHYYNFALDCFHPNVPASLGAQMAATIAKVPEASKINDEPWILRQNLDDAILIEAKKYAHT